MKYKNKTKKPYKSKSKFSPIVLFVYNRLETLEKLIFSLKSNPECRDSDLIIFSDGPKNKNLTDIAAVDEVRNYIKNIDGFNSVEIFKNNKNLGLANSIIQGLSEVSNHFESFIVLEDDLLVSPHFLKYMNTSLKKYSNEQIVWCINGFGLNPKLFNYHKKINSDFYWTLRPSSHGWGTWSNRWKDAIWNENELTSLIKQNKNKKAILKAGADIFSMFQNQTENKIDSWGVKWVINSCINYKFSLSPIYSYTSHQFSTKSTHIKTEDLNLKNDLKKAKLDFSYPENIILNKKIIKNLQLNIYGPKRFERVYYKIKKYFRDIDLFNQRKKSLEL